MPDGSLSDATINRTLLNKIRTVVRSEGVTLVLVANSRKTVEVGVKPSPEQINGAGIFSWFRQWILTNRAVRFDPSTGQHLLYLTMGGSAWGSSAWGLDVYFPSPMQHIWEPEIVPESDIKRRNPKTEEKSIELAEQESQLENQLLSILTAEKNGATLTALQKNLTKQNGITTRSTKIDRALCSLVNQNRIPEPKTENWQGRPRKVFFPFYTDTSTPA